MPRGVDAPLIITDIDVAGCKQEQGVWKHVDVLKLVMNGLVPHTLHNQITRLETIPPVVPPHFAACRNVRISIQA